MKRFISTIIGWVLLLASVFTSVPTQAQDDNQLLPFIYYYSYKTDSWIIERADGSDGFLLGEGLNCGRIERATWSPSGNWLLWHCASSGNEFAARWIAVSLDNHQIVTTLGLFDDLRSSTSVQWSPTGDDRLLVSALAKPRKPGEEPQPQPGVYVIDPYQDRFVLEMTFDAFLDCAEWSPDSRYVSLTAALKTNRQ